jgi:PAS domain S-box-containing protein
MTEARGETGWERLFWLVFDRTSNPVLLLDEQRCIVDLNSAALHLFGGKRSEVIGTSIQDSIRPSEQATSDAEWAAFLESGEYSGTRDLIRGDGSEVRVAFAASLGVVGGRRLAIYVAILQPEHAPEPPAGTTELPLTSREREIVTLIALGKETAEIAAELHISAETVRSHVRNAMGKLGAHTRAQLVAIALCGEHALDGQSVDT